ncbi:hypothetical protein CPB83DRAFT_553678 [Crepidotus variabilis]|uniref:Uncharacterized protein n=1 Tax=Crepidotus variabilis TaxID=179855 RepID=A0A9P6EA91_9AGAR|nr:hypothetical protein CPB83DRAFT_553678 [Crepidotus variabilis]
MVENVISSPPLSRSSKALYVSRMSVEALNGQPVAASRPISCIRCQLLQLKVEGLLGSGDSSHCLLQILVMEVEGSNDTSHQVPRQRLKELDFSDEQIVLSGLRVNNFMIDSVPRFWDSVLIQYADFEGPGLQRTRKHIP